MDKFNLLLFDLSLNDRFFTFNFFVHIYCIRNWNQRNSKFLTRILSASETYLAFSGSLSDKTFKQKSKCQQNYGNNHVFPSLEE